ncbi:nuclear transport factor 2 family protein [Aestuariibius insulae]|uniref:nuclear transport factor 2 family protein n=1 Tax=Aestuariibius insulae TaxID=2058287 RepID=UPI00345E97BA
MPRCPHPVLVSALSLALAAPVNAQDSADTRAVVEAFGAAQAAGDGSAMLALMAEDVRWRLDGDPSVPWVGEHRGKYAVGSFLETLTSNVTIENAEVVALAVDGPNAFSATTVSMIVGDCAVASNNVKRFEVRDGLIVVHNVYEDSWAVAAALTAEDSEYPETAR